MRLITVEINTPNNSAQIKDGHGRILNADDLEIRDVVYWLRGYTARGHESVRIVEVGQDAG